MKVIVGLGNPTREYQATRHNIGFDTITKLCDELKVNLDTKKFKGLCGFGYIGGEKVILVQPQTYMNLSGECVRAICDFYKLEAEDVIVICDDVSLPVGHLRIRAKGSAGGHNGLKNIILHLGTEEFARVRVGVGEKPEGWDLADYVLGRFPKEEEPLIREAIDNASKAVQAFVTDDIQTAMNRYNTKKQKPEKPKKEKAETETAEVKEHEAKAAETAKTTKELIRQIWEKVTEKNDSNDSNEVKD